MLLYSVEWPDLENINLKELTMGTVVLIALVSGHRGQSLNSLLGEDVNFREHKCVIVYTTVLKQTWIGAHVPPLELGCFKD